MTGLEWQVASAGDSRPWAVSFAVFYDEEFGRTLRVVYVLCGSWTVAEEVCQEAFVRAYRRWGQVSEMDRADAWVRRVACNLATSRFRRLASETRALARAALRQSPQVEALPGDLDRFWGHVRRLPSRQAQAVALHYADDLAVGDVAAVMGCAEGTVKAHLHAARRSLAEMYRAEEQEYGDG